MQISQSRIGAEWRWRPAVALAIVAFALCFAQTIVGLVGQWAGNPLYSFGFAVPLIGGYVLWTKLPALRNLDVVPDYGLGVAAIVTGIVMLVVGHLGALAAAQQASMIVVLTGLVLLFLGRSICRLLWFPIAYLVMMVPFWSYGASLLQGPSRVLSARIAVVLLHLTGVPSFREGTMIVLPNISMQVLQECSGVNQLITFLVMALPAAYLFLQGFWPRAVLVAASIPIAYASNGIRIALVGWLGYHGLGDGNVGTMHLMEGLAVSLIGYAALGACLSLLAKTGKSSGKTAALEVPDASSERTSATRRPWLEYAAVTLMLVAGAFGFLSRSADVQLAGPLELLPRQIADWTIDPIADPAVRFPAIDDELVRAYPTPSGERRFAGADEELVRTYRTSDGERARVYIGYHRSQRDGKELAGDASSALGRVATPLQVKGYAEEVEINQVERPQGRVSKGVLFWYDLNGRIVPDIYRAKGYTLVDVLTRGRSNGAAIMVGWDCRAAGSCEASRQKALSFIEALMPLLRHRLPS